MSEPVTATVSEEKENRALSLKMGDDGIVKIETLNDELIVCRALVNAKMVPESFDTAQKLFAARQLCRELGLPVVSAIRQVCVINGSPSLWGDTPLALVRRSALLEHFREWLIDPEYKEICIENKNLNAEIYAAVCEVQRKGFEKKQYFFTLEQAKTAGLINKKVWVPYRQRMIAMKARGLALKNEFSDVLMGVAMAEYDFDQIPNSGIRDVQDHSDTKELNKFFKPEAT